jgi:hypothetical protein
MSPAELVTAARAARDEGMARAQVADEERGSWDTKVIDQAISAFADTGETFSANDIWPLLPEVRGALIGARFAAAAVRGYIRKVGNISSTKKGTHAKTVGVWIIADSPTVPASDGSPEQREHIVCEGCGRPVTVDVRATVGSGA